MTEYVRVALNSFLPEVFVGIGRIFFTAPVEPPPDLFLQGVGA
jgi:hypothetical protein